jgi:two-component sensor histidine kinase
VLSSIYRSCSRTAKTKDELDDLYLNRLTAVARASQLTLDRASHDASLADLVHAAIEIFPDRSRIEVKVPHMAVQSDSVVPLALVLSELATNSVKHTDPGETSRISIRALVDPAADELVMEWQEPGVGQPDAALSPTRIAGFGTTLIKAMIEDQLVGSFERKFHSGGLSVCIRLPRVRVTGDFDRSNRLN